MGKGDRKSKRGKIWRGTTGKRRQNTSKKAHITLVDPPAKEKDKVKEKPKEEVKAKVVKAKKQEKGKK